jgi:hypothetical protein
MAMGKPRQFPLELEETEKAIEEYQSKYYNGEINIPSVAGFCAFIGTNQERFNDTKDNPVAKNIPLSETLKNFGSWCDAITIDKCSAPMARLILSQGFGGHKYTDKQDLNATGEMTINVKFDSKLKK